MTKNLRTLQIPSQLSQVGDVIDRMEEGIISEVLLTAEGFPDLFISPNNGKLSEKMVFKGETEERSRPV